MEDKSQKTIEDFGSQWQRYPEFDGYLGSKELLEDTLAPFVKIEDLDDKRVAEIGSGAGRFSTMLLDSDIEHLLALEPSAAFQVLSKNLASYGDRVKCVNKDGAHIPADNPFDYIFSIGVIHHIPNAREVIHAALQALKPGGKIVIWLYSYEGNELYINLVEPLRKLTHKLPPAVLSFVSYILAFFLFIYASMCRVVRLPMYDYMRKVILKLSWRHKMLTVYDQLNPMYTKYYTRDEAATLLEEAGFKMVKTHFRHGYSWLVIGTREA